jgi:flavin reductase (DIM6/NTAB) family NADH-FMN oxidoreductase RutF
MNDAHNDTAKFRRVMGRFATGVTVVTYERENEPAGMTANAFLSVSLEPQLILVSIKNESRFCKHIRQGDCYGVNFLTEQQEHISGHFAGRAVEGLNVAMNKVRGVPIIEGSLAHIVARVVQIHTAGDHQLYIAEVIELVEAEQARPLLFFSGQYGKLNAA